MNNFSDVKIKEQKGLKKNWIRRIYIHIFSFSDQLT